MKVNRPVLIIHPCVLTEIVYLRYLLLIYDCYLPTLGATNIKTTTNIRIKPPSSQNIAEYPAV